MNKGIRIVSVIAGLLLAFPVYAQALSISDIQATIDSLTRQLSVLQTKATAVVGMTFDQRLARGSQGGPVKALQDFLYEHGFFHASSTGYFGGVTSSAVSDFQAANGLESTGALGPRTRALLNSLMGNGSVAAIAGVGTVTMGETTVFSNGDGGNGNVLLVMDATLSQPATLQSLSFYVNNGSGDLRLGVYDATGASGGPGKLLAQTSSFKPTSGWNTAPVTAPVSLVAGKYWLAYLPSSNSLSFKVNGSIGTFKMVSFAFGSMPAVFPTPTGGGTTRWSFYATLNTTTTPPTPTVTLSASPASIISGESSVLSWSSTDATSCTGTGFSTGSAVSGSVTVTPAATAAYSITCTGAGGSANATASVTVTTVVTPTTFKIGDTKVETGDNSGDANLLSAGRVTLSQTGTLQSISFNVLQAAGQLNLGVYDATGPGGGPGALKATTGAFTPVVGWNTKSVASVTLAAGTYWLTYFPSDNNLHFSTDWSQGSYSAASLAFGAMPATFPAVSQTGMSTKSLYATLNTSGTVTPAPTASLTANPASITAGQSSIVSWSSTNATSCTGTGFSTGGATSGSVTVSPSSSTTYSISCSGAGGSASASASVTVNAVTPAPTVSISASPSSVSSGGSATLTWSSTNATSCTASGAWTGAKATSGTQSLTNLTASGTYTLTCTGAGGSASNSTSITVTVVTPAPAVTLLTSATSVSSGGSAILSWGSANATSCTASGAWSGSKALTGSQTLTNLTATGTYTLTCTGAGGSANSSVTITVTAVTPAPTVSISASPSSVSSGGSATLTWSSTNATSCTASGAWTGAKATSGTQSLTNLTASGTYTLTCTGAGGSASNSTSITVTVVTPAPAVNLQASPMSISAGQTSVLSWSSTNATSCTGTGFSTGGATSGSVTVSPSSSTTYSVLCSGAGGTTNKTALLTVTTGGTTVGPTGPVGPQASVACSGTMLTSSSNIQSAVDAAGSNTTFCLAAGTYVKQHVSPKSGDKFIGAVGAIMDGQNATVRAFDGSASNVTIQNLVIKNYTAGYQNSPVYAIGTTGWRILNNEISYNAGVGLLIQGNVLVQFNNIHHNLEMGIGSEGPATGIVVDSNEIAFNNYTDAFTCDECGGTKFWASDGAQITHNYTHDNHGPGLWDDFNNNNITYAYNRIENNFQMGIHHEIGYNASIHDNVILNNGKNYPKLGSCDWLWCAAIDAAASGGVNGGLVEIFNNTVTTGSPYGNGISLIQQARTDGNQSIDPWDVKNVWVHDNTIDMSGGGHMGGVQDINNNAIFTSRNNKFDRNHYILGSNTSPFYWSNSQGGKTFWQGQGMDANGTFQ